MHLAVIGHIAIDTIVVNSKEVSSLGGPPSYAGLAAKRLDCDVSLVTKVGADFPDEYLLWLARNGLNFAENSKSSGRTTRFRVRVGKVERKLQLVSRCDDIETSQLKGLKVDGAIISPIAGEIPKTVSDVIITKRIPTFLDPQGYIRRFSKQGFCYLRKISLDKLPKANIIKVDPKEGYYLTESTDIGNIAIKLRKYGFEKVIVTNADKSVLFASEGGFFKVKVPKVLTVQDNTGLGDILAGSFMAAFLKSEDFVWSVCAGVACASLAAKGKGINKIDEIREWESLAEQVKETIRPIIWTRW